MRRTIVLLGALALLVGCGGKDKPKVGNPLAEALSYVSPDLPAVAVVKTDLGRGQAAAAKGLVERFAAADLALGQVEDQFKASTGLSLTDDVKPLLGHDVVIGFSPGGAVMVTAVAKDEKKLQAVLKAQVTARKLQRGASASGFEVFSGPGGIVAVKGPTVLAGKVGLITQALAMHNRHQGLTPALFRSRLRGLPADSLVRIEGDASAFATTKRSKLPWVQALGRFAAVLRADDKGFHARLKVASDPAGLVAGDLPIAAGRRPPEPVGQAGLTIGLRDLRHTIEFAERTFKALDPKHFQEYDLAKSGLSLLGRTDLDTQVFGQLTGTTTISSNLQTWTLRTDVGNPKALADAMRGLQPLMPQILGALGFKDATVISEAPDQYTVQQKLKPKARYGVIGNTLVITTNTLAALDRTLTGKPARIGSLMGALTGRVRGDALRKLLIDRLNLPGAAALALQPLGDLTLSVHDEASATEATADLTIK